MRQEDLIIVLCTPRSGSTMLQRMVASHSQIHAHPEPNLLTPLKYLGYFDSVDAAPYDHINAAAAQREFFEELPGGDEDVYAALRSYALGIYGKVTEPTAKRFFLDKTPEYGAHAQFIAKLFPKAKYLVLTRHPMAIWHSQAHSFFGGDYEAAKAGNPILDKFIQPLAWFLRESGLERVHLRYEDLVAEPETHMRRVSEYLGIEFEPGMVDYGSQQHIQKSYGDPMGVSQHQKPHTASTERWAQDLASNPGALRVAQSTIDELDSADLETFGYPKDRLFTALEGQEVTAPSRYRWNSYRLKRALLMFLRKDIDRSAFGNLVRRVRYYCDVLLRA